ncbi:hypothetical protein FORC065_0562 [Yersinia enterocolitica]|nr:hypothetical protein FORC065_0562 [Yersinia enterocolitica]
MPQFEMPNLAIKLINSLMLKDSIYRYNLVVLSSGKRYQQTFIFSFKRIGLEKFDPLPGPENIVR